MKITAKKIYEENENYTDLDVNSELEKNLEKSIGTGRRE